MIKDQLPNIERYNINEYFNELIEWVTEGKQEGGLTNSIKAIHLEYETKDLDLTKFENHHQYIDLHYVLEGEEYVGIQEANKLVPVTKYDNSDDYQLFKGELGEQVLLTKGDFLVLFTNEAHVTGGIVGEPNSVKKIVFKIPVKQY